MVDFKKLLEERASKPKYLIKYKCRKCGDIDTYDFELPEHMRLNHYSVKRMRQCYGIVDEISREEKK